MTIEYREPTEDEFRAIFRGRPTAPTLYVRVDEADYYRRSMDSELSGEEWRKKWLK